MRTRYSVALSCVLLLLLSAPAMGKSPFKVHMQVFRITQNFSDNTFLDESIWDGTPHEWTAVKDSLLLFDKGKLQIGKDVLSFGDGHCFWNKTELTFEKGKEKRLPNEKVRMIYSPSFEIENARYSTFKIGSRQSFEYLDRTTTDTFVLKRIELPTGLTFDLRIRDIDRTQSILIDEMNITLRAVRTREKIPGIGLNVGKPILDEKVYSVELKLRPKKDYMIMLRPGGGQGAILIRINVS